MNQIDYIQYLKKDYIFFSKVHNNSEINELVTSNLSDQYEVVNDSSQIWKYYHYFNSFTPKQGWKIHISANHEEIQETLDIAAKIISNYKVSFKHLKSKSAYYDSNSKNANRATSGKFIVVYPKNNTEFLLLLEDLENALKNSKKGPYILNDKRWKNSNVFFRYGGFAAIYNSEGEMCIENNKGELIVDKRQPFYYVPDFVKNFDEYLEKINTQEEASDSNNKLNNYNILDALVFSNSGGIYKAENKLTKEKVIIKEARPNTAFDGKQRTAFERQKIEYDALKKLENIDGVVNAIDFFSVWEHRFIVEEFIEGDSLHSWLAKNYPFLYDDDVESYKEKIIFIIKQLTDIVTNIHKKGIVMGDLQPNNIIINEEFKVTLIDFETASSIHETPSVGLAVPTFSHSDITINKERDWFALEKILKFCLLPANTTPETEPYFIKNHQQWIEKNYGKTFLDIANTLSRKVTSIKKDFIQNYEKSTSPYECMEKISEGILENSKDDKYFTPNDVRQYKSKYGHLDLLSGGSGVLWALIQSKKTVNQRSQKWIEGYLLNNINNIDDHGLFTGNAGIAIVLYEYGYIKEANTLFSYLKTDTNTSDISLLSGQSGIGIALLSLYVKNNDNNILKKCQKISDQIIYNFENDIVNEPQDRSLVPKGLINGWSGPSLLFSSLYKYTQNEVYLNYAKKFLEKDILNLKENKETLQVYDDNKTRLLPYLSGGSIGIGIAIQHLQKVANDFKWHENTLDKITNLSNIKATISSGLFNGATGFLLLPSLVSNNTDKKVNARKNTFDLFSLFVAQKKNYFIFSGEFSYRFSFDLFSGSAGALLGLYSFINDNPLLWIPCIDSENFFNYEIKHK